MVLWTNLWTDGCRNKDRKWRRSVNGGFLENMRIRSINAFIPPFSTWSIPLIYDLQFNAGSEATGGGTMAYV